jgi:septum formation protein
MSQASPKLILGSKSPRRRHLLKEMGLSFRVQPPPVEEPPPPKKLSNGTASSLVRAMSKGKALSFPPPPQKTWVLTADTLVFLGREVLGKPRSKDEAITMLERLGGRTHSVWTGVTLRGPDRNQKPSLWHKEVSTRVTFSPLPPPFIRWYVDSGEPMDKAGAYGAQGIGTQLVSRIEGSYTNVVGLPLAETIALLEKAWGMGRNEFLVVPKGLKK